MIDRFDEARDIEQDYSDAQLEIENLRKEIQEIKTKESRAKLMRTIVCSLFDKFFG